MFMVIQGGWWWESCSMSGPGSRQRLLCAITSCTHHSLIPYTCRDVVIPTKHFLRMPLPSCQTAAHDVTPRRMTTTSDPSSEEGASHGLPSHHALHQAKLSLLFTISHFVSQNFSLTSFLSSRVHLTALDPDHRTHSISSPAVLFAF